MAAIDVVFTGLMLICFADQPDCLDEKLPAWHTAWVVKADGESMPCGWNSQIKTKPELRFDKREFNTPKYYNGFTCADDTDKKDFANCSLEYDCVNVYVDPKPGAAYQRFEQSLQYLPRIDEVDRRFKKVDSNILKETDYVPTRIHFETGVIGAGKNWPQTGKPRQWLRTDGSAGGALPRELSDLVNVTYFDAMTFSLKKCDGTPLIELTRMNDKATVTLRNLAYEKLQAEVSTSYVHYNDLAYLIWYYRLGSWDTPSNLCPVYEAGNKDAVMLRCVRERGKPCACSTVNCERDTIYWPPMLRSRF